MHSLARLLATICFWIVLATAQPSELRGLVVGVADGDTITVLESAKQQHRVRLGGIVAPERRQPFADRSRQHLAKWIHDQDVIVDWHKRDQYGRLVGVVIAFAHDIGLEQVRAGLAWCYREFAKEQRPEDRERYELADRAFKLYETFRPEVPAGTRGWGAAGVLDLSRVRTAARDAT